MKSKSQTQTLQTCSKHCPHNARANTDVTKAQHNVTCFVSGLMQVCAKWRNVVQTLPLDKFCIGDLIAINGSENVLECDAWKLVTSCQRKTCWNIQSQEWAGTVKCQVLWEKVTTLKWKPPGNCANKLWSEPTRHPPVHDMLVLAVWRLAAGMVFALTFEKARRSFTKALEGKPDIIGTKIMVWDLPKIYARMFRCMVLLQWKSTSGKGAMLVILGSNLCSSLLIFVVRRKRKDNMPR